MLGEQITRFIPRFRQKPIDYQAQARHREILVMAKEQGSFSLEEAKRRLEDRNMVPGVAISLVTHDVYTLVRQKHLGVRYNPTPKGKIPEFHSTQRPSRKAS